MDTITNSRVQHHADTSTLSFRLNHPGRPPVDFNITLPANVTGEVRTYRLNLRDKMCGELMETQLVVNQAPEVQLPAE